LTCVIHEFDTVRATQLPSMSLVPAEKWAGKLVESLIPQQFIASFADFRWATYYGSSD